MTTKHIKHPKSVRGLEWAPISGEVSSDLSYPSSPRLRHRGAIRGFITTKRVFEQKTEKAGEIG